MSAGKKHRNGLQAFLKARGVSSDTPEETIASLKMEWFRAYKNRWRRDYRKQHKEFTVALTHGELSILNKAVKRYRYMSRTKLLKSAAFAYLEQKYLVTDIVIVYEIRGLLQKSFTHIQKLSDDNLVPEVMGKYLLLQIATLEQEIQTHLEHPKTVEHDT